MISNIPLLGKNAPLVETFKLPRGYFPIKYRFAGFDYKDLTNFTNISADYFQKPFPQEFIDDVALGVYGNFTLKTYYGITVAGGFATPNNTGVFPVDSIMLAAIQTYLLAKYGGESPNYDMSINALARDLMVKANNAYTYPTTTLVSAQQLKKLEDFALITKSDPVKVKSILFSAAGGNSRKQYEENMIYFQTDGDRQIKQTIKPSVGRSSKDKNLEILTITPTREMILDGLRDLDVSVIGDEVFSALFLREASRAVKRIKNFVSGTMAILFFDATAIGDPPPSSLLILPFTPAPVLNLENGVGITLMFEKVRPDFVSKPRKRLVLAPTPTFALVPVVTPVPTQEQIKLSSFDEIETTEITPKSTNNTPIIGAIVVLLVSLIAFLLVKE